jgi:hypothetical protein
MATTLDWNLLAPLVQLAARPIGQTASRYEQHLVTDEIRIYFASGWYADVAWEMVTALQDENNLAAIKQLSAALYVQYEKHGMPISLVESVQKRVAECADEMDEWLVARVVGRLHEKQREFLATPMPKRKGYQGSVTGWVHKSTNDARLVSMLESRGREDNICATVHAALPMTPAEETAARTAWSTRLRELQAEARGKDREQVLVDNSWWDD